MWKRALFPSKFFFAMIKVTSHVTTAKTFSIFKSVVWKIRILKYLFGPNKTILLKRHVGGGKTFFLQQFSSLISSAKITWIPNMLSSDWHVKSEEMLHRANVLLSFNWNWSVYGYVIFRWHFQSFISVPIGFELG